MKHIRIACIAAVTASCGPTVNAAEDRPSFTAPPVEREWGALAPTPIDGSSLIGSATHCFFERVGAIPALSGEIVVRVSSVATRRNGKLHGFPVRSTLGDRETEACLAHMAASSVRKARARRDIEGDALVHLRILKSDPSIPIASVPDEEVAPAVARQRESLKGCGLRNRPLDITAWVAPGGKVLAAGVAAETPTYARGFDCVAEEVEQWTIPNSNPHTARVHFSLP